MAGSKTPSFVLELKLLSSKQDEGVLDLCFKYAWRIKVQLVKHARRQIQKLREDIHCRGLLAERAALKTAKDRFAAKRRTAIDHELNDIRMSYGLTKYQFKLWVQPLQHRYGRYIDSRTAQCIADDIWSAVDKYLFGDGKHLRIPHLNDVHSIESNDNKTGIRYRSGHILWKSLNMQISREKSNSYESEALTRRVKYCRIVRKQFPGRWHYYVQLVMEGAPPQKHVVGSGRVGVDPGTLSAAVASGRACILTALNDGVSDHENQINRIQRAMDRSRRAMNPDNYKSDGTVRKGRKRWVYSKRYRALQRAKRSLERRQAASLKCHHERLANDILELGDDVYTEDMNYRGLQKRASETTKNSRGRYNRKGRFGKSLKNGAPAMLLSIIDRKLHYEGRELHKVNTRTFRASQYNHVTDDYVKKRLSRRYNTINDRWVQRDLYSAFLLMNSADDLQCTDRSLCTDTYDTFLANHDRCIDGLINSNHKLLGSFGISRTA